MESVEDKAMNVLTVASVAVSTKKLKKTRGKSVQPVEAKTPKKNQIEYRFGENSIDEIPYRLQGDPQWDTAEFIATRRALRSNPQIQQQIERIWHAYREKDMKYGILRQPFIDMHLRMSQVLFQHFDYYDALACAIRDWKRDTTSTMGMQYDDFSRSIFEIVDIWTETVQVEEYVEFLKTLYARISKLPVPVPPMSEREATPSPKSRRRTLRRSTVSKPPLPVEPPKLMPPSIIWTGVLDSPRSRLPKSSRDTEASPTVNAADAFQSPKQSKNEALIKKSRHGSVKVQSSQQQASAVPIEPFEFVWGALDKRYSIEEATPFKPRKTPMSTFAQYGQIDTLPTLFSGVPAYLQSALTAVAPKIAPQCSSEAGNTPQDNSACDRSPRVSLGTPSSRRKWEDTLRVAVPATKDTSPLETSTLSSPLICAGREINTAVDTLMSTVSVATLARTPTLDECCAGNGVLPIASPVPNSFLQRQRAPTEMSTMNFDLQQQPVGEDIALLIRNIIHADDQKQIGDQCSIEEAEENTISRCTACCDCGDKCQAHQNLHVDAVEQLIQHMTVDTPHGNAHVMIPEESILPCLTVVPLSVQSPNQSCKNPAERVGQRPLNEPLLSSNKRTIQKGIQTTSPENHDCKHDTIRSEKDVCESKCAERTTQKSQNYQRVLPLSSSLTLTKLFDESSVEEHSHMIDEGAPQDVAVLTIDAASRPNFYLQSPRDVSPTAIHALEKHLKGGRSPQGKIAPRQQVLSNPVEATKITQPYSPSQRKKADVPTPRTPRMSQLIRKELYRSELPKS